MRNKLTLGVFLFILLLVGIQTVWKPFRAIPLAGAEYVKSVDSLTLNHWVQLDFQNSLEDSLRKSFGFRPHAVRFYNQLLYSFFDEMNPQVVAKGDTLFEVGYLPSIKGKDYLGEEKILAKIDSLDAFNRMLEAQGKHLVIVLAPNKWRSFQAVDSISNLTNYASFRQKLSQMKITFIDALQSFEEKNGMDDFPLHSKQGTHWSIYGGFQVANELRDTIAHLGLEIPEINVDSMEVGGPKNTDKDLRDLLNVMIPPSHEDLAYPHLSFNGIEKPTALVIGDSYYWTFYYLGIHQALFSEQSAFLYYNKSHVGQSQNERYPLQNEKREALLAQADLVVLVMSEPSLRWFGYGVFTDFQ